MTRRLVLCFDGTWNTVKDHTNVSRIHAAIEGIPERRRGDVQIKYYDEGVGTHWYDRFRGGALGWGMSQNIVEAYVWLIWHYRDDSDIFLFGFSRGAYTARSLAGLIGRCGIARIPASGGKRAVEELAKQAYAIYRGSNEPDDAAREFLENKSRRADIEFIGVWDTVGALGVPFFNFGIAESFHDTALGSNVRHAYHAIAIDEHRKDYDVTLWTANPGGAAVEQRWFPGAHSNVGGGYPDDLLPDRPLQWIAERAQACDLVLSDQILQLDGNEYRSPVRDSFAEFMGGFYRAVKLGNRHYRTIGTAIEEVVDETAFKKWAAEPGYRPLNLAHAGASIASPGVGISRAGIGSVVP